MRKKYISVLVSIMLIFSVITSHVYGLREIRSESPRLNSIYYDDKDYLYLKTDTQMLKLKKNFTGRYETLSEKEKKSIIDKVESINKSFVINEVELDDKDIRMKDNYIFYKDCQLMNIAKYIEIDNDFYKKNPKVKRSPIAYYIYKYAISKTKTLYHVKILTCDVGDAPYTPTYHNYVLVEDGRIKKVDLSDEEFCVDKVYVYNKNILMDGHDSFYWANSYSKAYLLDGKGKVVFINNRLSSFNKGKSYSDMLSQVKFVGINKGNIVFKEFEEQASYFEEQGGTVITYDDLFGLYEITSNMKVMRRKEKISAINKKYTIDGESCYLGKDNKIYCISYNVHGVVNLTEGKFKQFK